MIPRAERWLLVVEEGRGGEGEEEEVAARVARWGKSAKAIP